MRQRVPACTTLVVSILGVALFLATSIPAHAMTGLSRTGVSAKASPAKRVAKSPWTTPQVLGVDHRNSLFGTVTGVAADGASLTVWSRRGVRARWRHVNGKLGREELISLPAQGGAASGANVAVAADGTAVITWNVSHYLGRTRPNDGDYARYRFRDGTLGPAHRVSNTDYAHATGVFAGPAGRQPRVIWSQSSEPAHPQPEGLFVGRLDPAAGLIDRALLDDNDTYGENPAVAVDRSGNALVAWVQSSGLTGLPTTHQVLGRIVSREGGVGPLIAISGPGVRATPYPFVQVSLSPSGVGQVVWAEGEDLSGPVRIQTRQVTVAGALGPIVSVVPRLPSVRTPRAVAVASFDDGRGLVVWATGKSGRIRGRIVSRTAAGAPLPISTGIPGHYPRVAAHGGRATVIWTYVRPSGRQSGGRRDLEPGLASRSVTAAGVRGKPVDVFRARPGVSFNSTHLATNASGAVVVSWQAKFTQSFDGKRRGEHVLLSARRR
jgi:hypothetical protein